MKRLILFSMVCFIATVTQAQNDSIKTETLQEVTVQGSKVVQRVDGQTNLSHTSTTGEFNERLFTVVETDVAPSAYRPSNAYRYGSYQSR